MMRSFIAVFLVLVSTRMIDAQYFPPNLWNVPGQGWGTYGYWGAYNNPYVNQYNNQYFNPTFMGYGYGYGSHYAPYYAPYNDGAPSWSFPSGPQSIRQIPMRPSGKYSSSGRWIGP